MSLSLAAHATNFLLRWKVKPKRNAAFDVAKARAVCRCPPEWCCSRRGPT